MDRLVEVVSGNKMVVKLAEAFDNEVWGVL